MTIEIRHRITGALLWSGEAATKKEALERAVKAGANLAGAYLAGADLAGANLAGAYLAGATLPDGRTFEACRRDPLLGICDDPVARERALAAWGGRSWTDCPMHAAYGWHVLARAADRLKAAVAEVSALSEVMRDVEWIVSGDYGVDRLTGKLPT